MILDLLTAEGWDSDRHRSAFAGTVCEMCRQSERLFADGRLALCPGLSNLLAELAPNPDVLLGLLTGNIVGTAPLKLRAAGLDPGLFRVGAFGSDSKNGTICYQLPGAGDGAGRTVVFTGTNTVIIGDTPADVHCAQNGTARSVAVATGWYARGSPAPVRARLHL